MKTEITGVFQTFELPMADYKITSAMKDLFDNFNQEKFDKKIECPIELWRMVNEIYSIFGQDRPFILDRMGMNLKATMAESQDVILAFSAGLDSAYQAIRLKEMGYNVHLFHLRNLNAYEGAMSTRCAIEFAEKMGMDYIEGNVRRMKSLKPFWEDNPIKNQLLQAMMIDICMERGWNKISLGDDASMSRERPDCTLGINITDCKEVQEAFTEGMKHLFSNLEIILIDRKYGSSLTNKYDRLKKLKEYDVINYYYSCVGAGRFNQYNHNMNEKKYGINLPKYNCGCSCAKCALHNLLLYYKGNVDYPEPFIAKCWERLWNTKHGSIEGLFGKDIPLETRINNLTKY